VTDAVNLVRKLHQRRWRDKLGLFFVEGEDSVALATVEPVEVVTDPKVLAEVSTAAHPPRVIAVYRRADLPGWEERPATLALWELADPGNVGTLIRTADAFGAPSRSRPAVPTPRRRRRCARAPARSGACRSGRGTT
jgi:rRNA methylases